jgi:hypothetical protein
VREQLADRDPVRDLGREAGEILPDRVVERQLAGVDKLRDRDGGERLPDRADVNAISTAPENFLAAAVFDNRVAISGHSVVSARGELLDWVPAVPARVVVPPQPAASGTRAVSTDVAADTAIGKRPFTSGSFFILLTSWKLVKSCLEVVVGTGW